MRVYVDSLGCKLNQCERDALAAQFVAYGHQVVSIPEQADVCVVNTCAVTGTAAGKSRRQFRRLRRLNPRAFVVATGCYATLDGDKIEADLVITNRDKDRLVDLVLRRIDREWVESGKTAFDIQRDAVLPRTRPMVKIQDGCDNNCTYCIVHVLRGKQQSRPRQEILVEIADLVDRGYREVILTGVHIGAYGRDNDDNLVDLVSAILSGTCPERLRLSSIEPWDLPEGFLTLWRDPRVCRHLHLALQSGCDETLRRMNRHYTVSEYADLVQQARDRIPGLAVTTDLIAGFPGETEQEFAQSASFVGEMNFARAHVFPYSARPGTPAATMPHQVDHRVRRTRAHCLRGIVRASGEAFRARFVGHTADVLWEGRRADGQWSGLTDNYIRVYVDSSQNLSGQVCATRLCRVEGRAMHGELL